MAKKKEENPNMFDQKPQETPAPAAQPTTALAPAAPPGELAAAMGDYSPEELAEIQESTGLDGMPNNERRVPAIFWNLDMIDDKGNDVKPDRFYNAQTGETSDVVNCALVYIKKTREFSFRNKEKNIKVVVCRSFDLREGINQETGEIKRCDGCQSPFQHEGKKATKGQPKDCTPVMRVMAWDLDRQNFFIINVARTSYIPFMRHLETNFFGQFKQGNIRRDVPLYMLHSRFQLKGLMSDAGKRYYVLDPIVATDMYPKGILPKNIVLDLAPAAKAAKTLNQRDLVQDAPNTTNANPDAEPPVDGSDENTPF